MSEYWKSNPRKFCDACKCWIADNKASIAFHENGKNHKFNAQKRLDEIRRRGSIRERTAQKEEKYIEQMEKAAMNDYMTKDVYGVAAGGADISAQIYHEKKAERDAEKMAIEAAAAKAKAKIEEERAASGSSYAIGPQVPGVSTVSAAPLSKVEAPKSGTKWHKEQPKHWFEAVTEEGHTYYWHVETHESRWEPPEEGYLSIAEQETVNKKHEEKEMKKMEKIYVSQVLHGKQEEAPAEAQGPTLPPRMGGGPYGAWKTVETVPVRTSSQPVDLETPRVKEKPQANVVLHNDRLHDFTERSTPSLANDSAFVGEPVTFKKRKLGGDHRKNVRRRNDDD